MKFINSILGFEYILNKNSIILQHFNMTKENLSYTDMQLAHLCVMSKTDSKDLLGEFKKMEYVDRSAQRYEGAFYKFIDKKTYSDFISKGKFQLGSLKYYREIERHNSKDSNEGYSNLIIDSGNRQLFYSVIAGFDQYILCGTYNLENQGLMGEKFGGYIMKIKNINSFADKVKLAIGADSWQIDQINYTNFKAYRKEIEIMDIESLQNSIMNNELFHILKDMSEIPSIFSKPTNFSDEKELRLSFKMKKNVQKKLNFHSQGLLNEIEFIKL